MDLHSIRFSCAFVRFSTFFLLYKKEYVFFGFCTKSRKTKSQTDKIPYGQNPELNKIQNGQNPELDKIQNEQNPDLDKIQNGQNPE